MRIFILQLMALLKWALHKNKLSDEETLTKCDGVISTICKHIFNNFIT